MGGGASKTGIEETRRDSQSIVLEEKSSNSGDSNSTKKGNGQTPKNESRISSALNRFRRTSGLLSEKKTQEIVRESEINRFREKKKGFTGFRALLDTAEEEPEGGLESRAVSSRISTLSVGAEGAKSDNDRKIAIENLSGFTLFETEVLEDIMTAMSEATCKSGQIIFGAGQVFPYFVLLIDGEMHLNGEPVKYANEPALLVPGECHAKLEAVKDCRLWVITRLVYQKVTVQALQRKIERGGSLLESITEIPGLKELPKETREAIAAALKPVTFRKGEFLMKQGEEGHTMYFIEEGEVVIKQSSGRHKRIGEEDKDDSDGIVARRKRGDYIGEGALLDSNEASQDEEQKFGVRNASAIANSDAVKCYALGREEFQAYMGSLRDLFEYNLLFRVLKSLDLTKDLDDAQLSMLVSTLEEGAYSPGEYIVHQGEIGDMFYIVKEGTLECTMKTSLDDQNEKAKRIGTLIGGDYFGEGALLTNAPRRCNVFAVEPGLTKVWGLKRSNFEKFLSESLKEKLGDTFAHRKGSKDEAKQKSIEWDALQRVRTLGSGSYGTVVLVRHKFTGETHALKRIRKATVIAKRQQRFVKNERELLSATSSPFLVNLISTYNKGDSVYMLMEVCLGGELYTLMKDTVDARNMELMDEDELICGCFELESQCRFYMACIVLGIEYIHSQGVIHRDMKPENLLLTERGYLKLADFGFAKMVHDQRTYSLCGTPEYTAPEVYKRSGHSKGVDWWSLGVILYEMASGFSPFHVMSQNSWDCYIEISKYENFYPNIQFPSLFDEHLCDLLLRLMHPNPTKRFGTRKLNSTHVKEHSFFSKSESYSFAVDWDRIANQTYQLDAKYRPRVPESGLDTNNFESCDDRHEEDNKYVDRDMMDDEEWAIEF